MKKVFLGKKTHKTLVLHLDDPGSNPSPGIDFIIKYLKQILYHSTRFSLQNSISYS